MKTSEDKLNDALREVLKRKFDDYEELPNPASYERIRDRVKPQRSGRYWWLAGGLALLICSGLLVGRYSDWVGMSQPTVGQPKAIEVTAGRLPATARSTNGPVAGAAANETVTRRKRLRGIGLNAARDVAYVTRKPGAEAHRIVDGANPKPGSTPAAKPHRLHFRDWLGATAGVESGMADSAGHQTNQLAITVKEIPADALPETASTVELPAARESLLEELDNVPAKEAQVPLRLRGVGVPKYKPGNVIVTNPARIAWLFNASALHSYQILTVPSYAARDYQNFSFPALFTARSMGYKVSAGVERNGIQLQLHYSGFRQTYSYEVARDSYLVQPGENGSYHTVRQGDRQEENRQFSMLGVGVTRQLRWGHSPVSRFYAAFGLEYSHALNSSQSLGWVSMGLGKQFAISRNTAFSFGPYAEFSPVKVKGTANPFYYQPYRVGISAGLRFVRP